MNILKTIIALALLSSCNDFVAPAPEDAARVAAVDAGADMPSSGGGGGGSLPLAFNERGCQWDSPACGQPTPGSQVQAATDPVPDQTGTEGL